MRSEVEILQQESYQRDRLEGSPQLQDPLPALREVVFRPRKSTSKTSTGHGVIRMQQVRESLQLLKKRMNNNLLPPTSPRHSQNFPPPTPHRPSPSDQYRELLSSQHSSLAGTLQTRRFQEDRASLPTYQNPQYRRCFRVRVEDYEAERDKEVQMAKDRRLQLPPIGRVNGPPAPSIGHAPVRMKYQLYQIPAPAPQYSSPMNYSSKVSEQLQLLNKRIREKQVLSTQRAVKSRHRNTEFEDGRDTLREDAEEMLSSRPSRNFYSAHRYSLPRTINTNRATADQRYQKEQILKRINGGLNSNKQPHFHQQPYTSMESRQQDVF